MYLAGKTGSWQSPSPISSKMLQALCAAGCAPHLGAPGRGGSSHPSPAGGPGCQERPEPTGRSQHLSREGYRAAAGPTGEGAAGLGGRGPRERGAEPEAAAAVNKQRDRRQDRGQMGRLGSESMNDHALLVH